MSVCPGLLTLLVNYMHFDFVGGLRAYPEVYMWNMQTMLTSQTMMISQPFCHEETNSML